MHVMIIGVGALGSVVAELLAPVAELTLVDFDIVQEENLARQKLYTKDDVGKHKVTAAKEHLDTTVHTIAEPFTNDTPLDGIDVIVEGTDDLHTRLVINDVAKRANIPCVFGTVAKKNGMAFRNNAACWQCIMQGKQSTDDCSTAVDLPTVRTVAGLQAMLVTDPVDDLMVVHDGVVRPVTVQPQDCQACRGTYTYLDEPFRLRYCEGAQSLHARPTTPTAINLEQLQAIETYPSAVKVAVGEGTALVHAHGLIEFTNVPAGEAKTFAAHLLDKTPSH